MPQQPRKQTLPPGPTVTARYVAGTKVAMVVTLVVLSISALWSAVLLVWELHLLSRTPAPLLGHLLKFVLPALIGLQLYRYRDSLTALESRTDEATVEMVRRQMRFWIVVALALAAQLVYTIGYALHVAYLRALESTG